MTSSSGRGRCCRSSHEVLMVERHAAGTVTRMRIGLAAAGGVAVGVLVLLVPALSGAAAPASVTASGARGSVEACAGSHWVGTWQAPPQSSSLGRPDDAEMGLADGPARSFQDQTLRMVVTNHVGGSAIRVHLGNRYGIGPLSLGAATLGTRQQGSSLVPGSVRALTFGGSRTVVIAPGEQAVSDPVFIDVPSFTPLAISFSVSGSAALDYHQWSQSTQYAAPVGSGDHADDESGEAFTEEMTSSYVVTAVDVLAPSSVGAIVTLGDSITDGIGSSPNTDQRWPDQLARRLVSSLSVVNAGIAGNHVATSGLTTPYGIGEAARDRVDVDALRVSGATDLFVYEGINDIFMADPTSDPASKVVAGYQTIIDKAHAAGLRVIGATVTPAGLPPEKEAARQAVNTWIRTSGAYDAVVDFDAIARNPESPTTVRPEFDAYMAHLTDGGYQALAASIDPTIFQGTGC